MSDVTLEQVHHIARKRFTCDHCMQAIMPGQRYLRVRGIWEGAPGVFRAHDECEYAAQQWREYHDSMWDEGCLLKADIEPEDHTWLLDEFPIVAERLGIAAWALPEYPRMRTYWPSGAH